MDEYMPYITTIICSMLSGFASYIASRKQNKADLEKLEKQHKSDLEKLEKQHELDIEKERELFKMEKEKMELEHKHQLELNQKDMENQLGANLTNTLITEAMKMPEVRRQFTQGIKNNGKKHK